MPFPSPRLSRRRFLGLTAAAGAVTALPFPSARAADGCHPITTAAVSSPCSSASVPWPSTTSG